MLEAQKNAFQILYRRYEPRLTSMGISKAGALRMVNSGEHRQHTAERDTYEQVYAQIEDRLSAICDDKDDGFGDIFPHMR